MRTYKDLLIWNKAMSLTEMAYRFTKDLPDSERFGLISQIQRSAVSIPSNIAEGAGRGTDKEFSRFLDIAKGSLNELGTQIKIAVMVHHVCADAIFKEIDELGKMTHGLRKKLLAVSYELSAEANEGSANE